MIKYWDTLSIPIWAIGAIEYGDYSGLSDSDIEALEGFFADFPLDRFTIQWGNDREFCNNPAFGLPCECIDADFYKHQTVTA